MSIGRLFLVCMAGAGLIVFLVGGRTVVRDFDDYAVHVRAIRAGMVLDASLRAMEVLSIERGPSFLALNAAGPVDRRPMDDARAAAAAALDELNRRFALLGDSGDTPPMSSIAALTTARDGIRAAWLASHRLVDESLSRTPPRGDAAQDYAIAEMTVQRRFVPLLNGLQARVAVGAAESASVIQIARYAADLRELAGLQATLITPAVAEKRRFSVDEEHAAQRYQGEIDRLRTQIDAAIDYVGRPRDLTEAWAVAQAGYFTQGRAVIDRILTSGAADGRFPLTVPEVVAQFTPALPSLIGLRDAAINAALVDATRTRDLSWERVATSASVLVGVLMAIAGLTIYFRRQVVEPLIDLTTKVSQLADGNRSVAFGLEGRGDEVGGLARAMRVFRDALIKNEELQGQLLHAQKMQAIGTMAGGVAHELNNLMQPILLLTESLADSFPDADAETHEDLAVIIDHAQRARDIVGNIVSFSRKSATTVTKLDLAQELREAGPLLRSLLPTSVTLEEQITDIACFADVNRTELIQVVTNLIINAAQAMNHRGPIGIALRQTRIGEAQSSALDVAPGDYADLSVVDRGCGIEPRLLDRIFDPFFTTKPPGQGSGLGLSVAYGIVRAWKGAVQVHSTVGHGTTFSILIPLSPPPRERTHDGKYTGDR